MSAPLLTVSPSPHTHLKLTVPQVMRTVILALLPAMGVSFYLFGWGAVYVTVVSVVACVLFEYLIGRYLLNRPSSIVDGSAVITGILLAFNLPSNLPVYMVILGAMVAIGIGKMSFGGLGNNPFNPALVGRVFLLVSFPAAMTRWPLVAGTGVDVDGLTGATALGILKDGLKSGETMEALMTQLPAYDQLFLGLKGGSLGEVSVLALLAGFGYMLYKKVVTWHTPVAMLVSIFVFSSIFRLIDPGHYMNPVFHLLTGGVMLGALFMATDYVTSPFTHKGMLIFGAGIGIITMVIRLFGAFPEGVSFAILIMNAFVPLINRMSHPKEFGVKKVMPIGESMEDKKRVKPRKSMPVINDKYE